MAGLVALRHWVVWGRLVILQTVCQFRPLPQEPVTTDLFLFDFVISFFSAAPSRGLSSSKEHSRSSDTDMTAPKFYIVSLYHNVRVGASLHRTLHSS